MDKGTSLGIAEVYNKIPMLPLWKVDRLEKPSTQGTQVMYKELQPGDIVQIFEDPVTCNKLEGGAILKEKIEWGQEDSMFERWDVYFPGETVSYTRVINKANH